MGPELAALVARAVGGEKFDVTAECARLGVSPKTFYKYRKRFRIEGVEGFYPRTRRPLISPSSVSAAVEDVVVEARKDLDGDGWDAGAEQIAFWIADHPHRWPGGEPMPSRATINRILVRRGQIMRVPQRRPRAARRRFESDQPNHLWQMDGFDYTLADRRVVCILQIVDDCSRFDLALRAARSENAIDVWSAVVWASTRYGLPARFLTDNGGAFSGARRGWVSALEQNLRCLGVRPCTSSVAHPQTCGKGERAHSTVLKWLRKRPPAGSLEQLQGLLDEYRGHYNHRRRKTHLNGLTPAQRYDLGPIDGPGTEPTPWPVQIQTAKVSASGCISVDSHLLGVGRRYAGTTVTLVRQNRQIAVFAVNQLIGEFTLTGTRRYQSKNAVVSPMS